MNVHVAIPAFTLAVLVLGIDTAAAITIEGSPGVQDEKHSDCTEAGDVTMRPDSKRYDASDCPPTERAIAPVGTLGFEQVPPDEPMARRDLTGPAHADGGGAQNEGAL